MLTRNAPNHGRVNEVSVISEGTCAIATQTADLEGYVAIMDARMTVSIQVCDYADFQEH